MYLQELSLPPLVVKDVGLFVKNWDALANLITDVDYFTVERLGDSPPHLTAPSCDTAEFAYAGIEYARPLTFVPGSPEETVFSLTEAPPGMIYDETQHVVRWIPPAAAAGQTVQVAVQAGNTAGSASVSWSVTVRSLPAVWDEFDGPELDGIWEVFEPQAGAAEQFVDGRYRVILPDDVSFDWWSNGNNWARQVRRDDMGPDDFAIESRVALSTETVLSHDEFHVGLMVYFEEFDAFIWGFFGAAADQPVTGLQVERTGSSRMARSRTDANPVNWSGTPRATRPDRVATSGGSTPLCRTRTSSACSHTNWIRRSMSTPLTCGCVPR